MDENILEVSVDGPILEARSHTIKGIIYGGLTVGVLDGFAATINAGLKGISPVRVFQFIASGLLGNASFDGGVATVALGILLHFVIAFTVVAIFYGASLRLPILIRHAVVFGIVYGVAVYFAMSRIVVPLSAAPKQTFSVAGMLTSIMIHILCVGLPSALIARKFNKGRQELK